MKKTVLIIVALFAAVMAFSPVARAQDTAPVTLTCSGQEAAFFAQNFVFGLLGDNGFCDVRTIFANTQAEAQDCARKACPDCTVEDLTGVLKFSSSGPEVNEPYNYCPLPRH